MGTSWTVHEISVKIFETWSEKQSRMANICLFQMSFSQWRAAQIIFVFSRLFLYRTLTLCTQNFKVHWPALHVFCNIFSHFVENIAKNDICHKILPVLHHLQKFSKELGKKWLHSIFLLFIISDFLKFHAKPIVQCECNIVHVVGFNTL